MNFKKYLNLIVLIFLLEIISQSSGDEWKKLKRKLIALALLQSIRVKTIIPLPVPLPVPVVVRKIANPVVLPAKKVPYLVPKPVPVYQIIPKFVTVYDKDPDYNPNHKQWLESEYIPKHKLASDDNHWTTNEEYYGSDSHQIQHKLHHMRPNPYNEEMIPLDPFIHQNKFNHFHDFQDKIPIQTDYYIEEVPKKKKVRGIKKLFKPKPKLNDRLKGFNEFFDDEDLLMLANEPNTKTGVNGNQNSDSVDNQQNINTNIENLNEFNINNNNNWVPIDGQSIAAQPTHQMASDFMINDNKELAIHESPSIDTDPGGVKTSIKRIKVGEIRLKSNQLKALLDN